MKKFILEAYLMWLESKINADKYDDVLSRKIDRVREALGE